MSKTASLCLPLVEVQRKYAPLLCSAFESCALLFMERQRSVLIPEFITLERFFNYKKFLVLAMTHPTSLVEDNLKTTTCIWIVGWWFIGQNLTWEMSWSTIYIAWQPWKASFQSFSWQKRWRRTTIGFQVTTVSLRSHLESDTKMSISLGKYILYWTRPWNSASDITKDRDSSRKKN